MKKPSRFPVVIFAPYSAIWVHSFPEALVASSIMKAGTDVIYVPCDGMMSDGCTAMLAHRIYPESAPEARMAICNACRKRRTALSNGLGSSVVTMDSLLTSNMREQCQALASSVELSDIMSLEVDGYKVGRIALHETILRFKVSAINELTTEALTDFRVRLFHVLLSLRVTQALIEKHSPSKIVTYNTHLSTNYIMMLAAQRMGVKTFGLHAGGNMAKRLSGLYVFERDMVQLYKNWISQFEREWSAIPSTIAGIRDAALHFQALTTGKTAWVYSAPKKNRYFDVRKHYEVPPQQRILLAMLSSYDELFSSQVMGVMSSPSMMFATQIDWIKALIDFARQRPDVFLIIRVHPREMPNHRDNIHSVHAKKLSETLIDLPPNVRVNWPQEKISLYDLMPHVDVGLNGWSSTGKEMALLGIPVVLFTEEILLYPSSLNLLAKSQDDYLLQIDRALRDGWSFERIRHTFRWLAVEYNLGTIDISDRFTHEDIVRSLPRRILGLMRRTLAYRFEASRLSRAAVNGPDFAKIILDDRSIIDLNLEKQRRLNDNEEAALIRDELRGIVETVFSQVPEGVSRTIDALRATTAI